MIWNNFPADICQLFFLIALNNSIHKVLISATITQLIIYEKGKRESLKRSLIKGIYNNDKINKIVTPVINGIGLFLYRYVLNIE